MILAAVSVALAVAATGCFSPQLGDGDVACGPGGTCPPQYHCDSGRCYRASSAAGSRDLGPSDDLSADVPADLAGVTGDLALADLAHPVDNRDLAGADLALQPADLATSHPPDLSGVDCQRICSNGCAPCCAQSCNGTNCACSSGCSCDFTCSQNNSCNISCTAGASCSGSSTNNSHAVIDCNDASCDYSCANKASCQLNCGGANGSCILRCNNNASCQLTGCFGQPTQLCPDGTTQVCHHACP